LLIKVFLVVNDLGFRDEVRFPHQNLEVKDHMKMRVPTAASVLAATLLITGSAWAGSVKGKATLEGPAPQRRQLAMSADPKCEAANPGGRLGEVYVVGDGGALQNVFVYVKDGLASKPAAPATMVTLDQHGCMYTPHVLGIQVGQELEIKNSDPTLHNIHALPKGNKEFNTGQPIQGMKTNHTFDNKEIMVPFKCDVHGWMNAYVGVLDHPYFATTGADGTFELKTLPPGTYTIEAWHEKLGATTQSVTLGPKETKEIVFTFKAPA